MQPMSGVTDLPEDEEEGFQLRPEPELLQNVVKLQQPRKLQLVSSWEKQVVMPVDYLIDGLLIDLPGGIVLLSGPTSVGKTKVAELFAFSVATGHPFHQAHPVARTGGVVWFAAEGERQVVPYMRCLEQSIGGYQPIDREFERATPMVVVPAAEIPKLSRPERRAGDALVNGAGLRADLQALWVGARTVYHGHILAHRRADRSRQEPSGRDDLRQADGNRSRVQVDGAAARSHRERTRIVARAVRRPSRRRPRSS